MSLLKELQKENNKNNSKIKNKKSSDKNSSYHNNKKTSKTRSINETKSRKSHDIPKINININGKNNQTQKMKEIYFENLTSYYPSPTVQKEFNNNKSSPLCNNENLNNEKSNNNNNNSYIIQSAKSNVNRRIILTPNNNNRYNQKIISPTTVSPGRYSQNQILFNSHKFLPQNECSLFLDATKYNTYNTNTNTNTNINSNSNRKNDIYNNSTNNYEIIQSQIKNKCNNNNRPFNSIRLIDNSLSTNFFDRPSSNDNNNTLSLNDNNHQRSFGNNISNKNTSYLFPSKENNNNNNINADKQIFYKKISTDSYQKNNKIRSKIIFNGIISDRNVDTDNSRYNNNIEKTNSVSQNQKIKINENNHEKKDGFTFIKEIKDGNINNLKKYKIISGIVNENVKNKRNKQETKNSREQESEPITMQSMSDSKILEIANYYLNEEETVDKIQIDDILLTKNNKKNFNVK